MEVIMLEESRSARRSASNYRISYSWSEEVIGTYTLWLQSAGGTWALFGTITAGATSYVVNPSSGAVPFTWAAQPGENYRLQSRNASGENWTTLVTTTSTTTATIDRGDFPGWGTGGKSVQLLNSADAVVGTGSFSVESGCLRRGRLRQPGSSM